MKKLFLCLIAGLIFTATHSQVTKETDWHEMQLKGKVKSLRETCYKAKKTSGEIVKRKRKNENKDEKDSYIIFNDAGRQIEVNEFTSDGRIYKKWTYVYDDKGIESEVNSYNADGKIIQKGKYINTYDAKGNLVTRISLRADSSLDNKYTY